MADGVFLKLIGEADLQAMLTELSSDMRRRVVRGALRDAAKPFVKFAKVLAKAHDYGSKGHKTHGEGGARRIAGTLRRAITVISSKRKNGANAEIGVFISIRASKAQKRARPVSGDPFYWRWVLGGHKMVPRAPKAAKNWSKIRRRLAGVSITQRRRGATKRVQGDPIFDRAFASQSAAAVKAFEPAIIARIAKANARKTTT